MQSYINLSLDILSNIFEEKVIQQDYKENIVFRWLKRPCLMYCNESRLLSQKNLFYICFQLLDTLKQCTDLTDCQVQSDMQCIPHAIENIFAETKYCGDIYQCALDRLLVMLTLHTLLRMIDDPQVKVLDEYMMYDINCIMPNDVSYDWYSQQQKDIWDTLTNESPFYKRSANIMNSKDNDEIDDTHLIGYIQCYVKDIQHYISEEIAAHKDDTTTPPIIAIQPQDHTKIEQLEAQIKKLENTLHQKNEEIATLRQEIETATLRQEVETATQPATGYIQIKSKCKSKVAAILSAMYYAGYFYGTGNLTDKDRVVTYILQHGFNYSTDSEPQLVSAYIRNGGNLDFIKDELRDTLTHQLDDALTNLSCIQKVRSTQN